MSEAGEGGGGFPPSSHFLPMDWENRPLVTDEPVEFEKSLVEVQDFRNLLINLEESVEHTSKLIKKDRKIITRNRLHL